MRRKRYPHLQPGPPVGVDSGGLRPGSFARFAGRCRPKPFVAAASQRSRAAAPGRAAALGALPAVSFWRWQCRLPLQHHYSVARACGALTTSQHSITGRSCLRNSICPGCLPDEVLPSVSSIRRATFKCRFQVCPALRKWNAKDKTSIETYMSSLQESRWNRVQIHTSVKATCDQDSNAVTNSGSKLLAHL